MSTCCARPLYVCGSFQGPSRDLPSGFQCLHRLKAWSQKALTRCSRILLYAVRLLHELQLVLLHITFSHPRTHCNMSASETTWFLHTVTPPEGAETSCLPSTCWSKKNRRGAHRWDCHQFPPEGRTAYNERFTKQLRPNASSGTNQATATELNHLSTDSHAPPNTSYPAPTASSSKNSQSAARPRTLASPSQTDHPRPSSASIKTLKRDRAHVPKPTSSSAYGEKGKGPAPKEFSKVSGKSGPTKEQSGNRTERKRRSSRDSCDWEADPEWTMEQNPDYHPSGMEDPGASFNGDGEGQVGAGEGGRTEGLGAGEGTTVGGVQGGGGGGSSTVPGGDSGHTGGGGKNGGGTIECADCCSVM
jgi:hypothetical protein